MLLSRLSIEVLIANLLVLLVAMTVHEFAHNYVAWKMGDPMPARMGKLTLNPMVHINWIGWLMFAVIGFGVLGTAQISPYNMPLENRRWRWLAAIAAGPLSNLSLAVISAVFLRLLIVTGVQATLTTSPLGDFFLLLIYSMVQLNVLLFVFNLIPLFPIDGWQIVYSLLPPDLASQWERYRGLSYNIFIGLIILSFASAYIGGLPNPLSIIISQPTIAITRFLLGI